MQTKIKPQSQKFEEDISKKKVKTKSVLKEKQAVSPKKAKFAEHIGIKDNNGVKQTVLSSLGLNTVSNKQAENISDSAVLAVLLQVIEKYKIYPKQARRSQAEGSCVLKITVNDVGEVVYTCLQQKSGKRVLDAACEKLGKKLHGLNVGSKRALSIAVPVHYSLTE